MKKLLKSVNKEKLKEKLKEKRKKLKEKAQHISKEALPYWQKVSRSWYKSLRILDHKYQILLHRYKKHIREIQNAEYPEEYVKPSQHAFLWLCSLCCLLFFIWAIFAQLDIVSSAQGEVNPSGQVKKIQHLEGGIVRRILVQEGQSVSVNQPLIELESTRSGADVAELKTRLVSLQVEILRLQAQAQEQDTLAYPDELKQQYPKLIAQSMALFNNQKVSYRSNMTVTHEQVKQREEELSQIKSRLKNQRHELRLLNEQVKISKDLLKDGITPRYEHLQLLQQRSRLISSIEEDNAALKGAEAALEESKATLDKTKHGSIGDVRDQLEEAQRQYDELSQRLLKLEDSLKRTVLRSPVAGLVKVLNVVAEGEVIKTGDTVAEIVPSADLIVDAHLPPQDVGYVVKGLHANVRLASSDAIRFGILEGTVSHVSPDTFVDPDTGQTFYKVKIKPEKNYFSYEDEKYFLVPGVQVQVSILIGKRSVMQYLLEPFIGASQQALRER